MISIEPQIDYVEALADGFGHMDANNIDTTAVQDQLEMARARQRHLKQELSDLSSGMEVGSQLASQFQVREIILAA